MKALLLTNEYPPHVYGGAGVHVEFLSRELARLMDVEVRCFGDQQAIEGRLKVWGYPEPEGMTAPDYLRPVFGAMGRGIAWAATDVDATASLSFALDGAAPAGLTFNADGSYSFDASNTAYQSLGVGQSTTLTSPAPLRIAPRAARTAAPLRAGEPAMTAT